VLDFSNSRNFRQENHSPLENYVEVIAVTKPDEPTVDQRIVHQLVIKRRKFQALE
jgi:hypothetical protein